MLFNEDVDENSQEEYSCDSCVYMADTAADLKLHIQLEHVINHEACQICGEVFPDKKTMHAHQRKAHADEELMCDICNKTYCVSLAFVVIFC